MQNKDSLKIAVIGAGYVGLVTAACFAEMGREVICIEIDKKKVDLLNKAEIPIYEPNLRDLVVRNLASKRLSFSSSLSNHLSEVEILFICVGTPTAKDGKTDLSQVYEIADFIGSNASSDLLLVTKSTVPVGTTQEIKRRVNALIKQRNLPHIVEVASNPEFLKEGNAVADFMSPDRVIVGVESDRARELMTKLYRPFLLNNFRVVFMNIASAELTKYASNAMLATRISFMNEIANLAEKVGADISNVRMGMGADKRIGKHFLYAGCGYGGSCFPKDIRALIQTGKEHDVDLKIVKSVEEVNEKQKDILFKKLFDFFNGKLDGLKICIWGLSFKPETDDIREACSLNLIESLLNYDVQLSVYDPVAMPKIKAALPNSSIHFANDIYEAAKNADVIIIPTEWKEFRLPDWGKIKKLAEAPLIIDGRNIYTSDDVCRSMFKYIGIGVL